VASLQFHNLVRPHDIASSQLDATSGQSDVMPPPDITGGQFDPPQRGAPRERNAAVPVQRTGECTRLGQRRGVTIHEFRRKTAVPQRFRERAPGHQLWQRLQPDEPHVPRPQALPAGPQRLDERGWVWRGQNRERSDSVRMPAGHAPGLVATRVMTNAVGLGKSGSL